MPSTARFVSAESRGPSPRSAARRRARRARRPPASAPSSRAARPVALEQRSRGAATPIARAHREDVGGEEVERRAEHARGRTRRHGAAAGRAHAQTIQGSSAIPGWMCGKNTSETPTPEKAYVTARDPRRRARPARAREQSARTPRPAEDPVKHRKERAAPAETAAAREPRAPDRARPRSGSAAAAAARDLGRPDGQPAARVGVVDRLLHRQVVGDQVAAARSCGGRTSGYRVDGERRGRRRANAGRASTAGRVGRPAPPGSWRSARARRPRKPEGRREPAKSAGPSASPDARDVLAPLDRGGRPAGTGTAVNASCAGTPSTGAPSTRTSGTPRNRAARRARSGSGTRPTRRRRSGLRSSTRTTPGRAEPGGGPPVSRTTSSAGSRGRICERLERAGGLAPPARRRRMSGSAPAFSSQS